MSVLDRQSLSTVTATSEARGADHLAVAAVCTVLGAVCLAVLAWGQTGTVAGLVLGSTLFVGPGLAVVACRRERLTVTAWLAFPLSCAVILLGTRVLLALEVYRPMPVAVGVAAAVGVTGAVRLVTGLERRSDVQRRLERELDRAARYAVRRELALTSPRARVRDHLWSWQALSVAAVIAWAVGCWRTDTADLTNLGLLGELSLAWYAAVALAAAAVVLAIRRSTAQYVRPMAGVTGVVLLILHGTAPFVYGAARYAWTYKHVGLADYFGRFHDNDRATVDIYHAFPAFFSALGVIAGSVTANGLMVVARFWPLLIELACVLVIRRMFGRLSVDGRLPWIAALLFISANWIGQDYLSPQSVSLVLALTIYAMLFRQLSWRVQPGEAPRRSRLVSADAQMVVGVLACWVAIVVSHPLTPFLILPGLLVGFPLFGFRPRWLPVVMAAIAVGHAWLQRGIVEDQGIGRHLGSVVENVQSRGTTNGAVPTRVPEFKYFFLAAIALSLLVVALAVIGSRALMRSVGGRRFLGLAAQAISPTLFLAVESYGQEGVLRAFLFSLPWLCLFAAMPVVGCRGVRRRRAPGPRARAVLVAGIVGGVAALATVALFVRDLQYAVSAGDVAVVDRFEAANPTGGLLIGSGVQPNRATAWYPDQQYIVLASPPRLADGTIDAPTLLETMQAEVAGIDRAVYLAFGPSLTDRAIFDGVMSRSDLSMFEDAVRADPDWHLVFRDGASTLYRFGAP
jgi:hypothetical protein